MTREKGTKEKKKKSSIRLPNSELCVFFFFLIGGNFFLYLEKKVDQTRALKKIL